MITVNGIRCYLTIPDSKSMTALNNYRAYVEDCPDEFAVYGILTDGIIEVVLSNNTSVCEITIAW